MTTAPPHLTWKDEVPCDHHFTMHWCRYLLATTPCMVCRRCGKVELIGEERGQERFITEVRP